MKNRKLVCLSLLFSYCVALLFSMSGCENIDQKIYDFYLDTCDGKYNAIQFDLEAPNTATYYIEERYGIFSDGKTQELFAFDHISVKHGGGENIRMYIATKQSYYRSVAEPGHGSASMYHGEMGFNGSCEISPDGTTAKVSIDGLHSDKIPPEPGQTLTMTKTKIPDDDVIPFETALQNQHYVPDTYFDFLADRSGMQYICEMANLRIDASTMTGEWITNGAVIPIRLELSDKVPYLCIRDTRDGQDEVILTAYGNMPDDTAMELYEITGKVFYAIPTEPVILKKIGSECPDTLGTP